MGEERGGGGGDAGGNSWIRRVCGNTHQSTSGNATGQMRLVGEYRRNLNSAIFLKTPKSQTAGEGKKRGVMWKLSILQP